MYYSASTFGSNTSAIGLAVAQSPAGPWQDRGLVVATRVGAAFPERHRCRRDVSTRTGRRGSPTGRSSPASTSCRWTGRPGCRWRRGISAQSSPAGRSPWKARWRAPTSSTGPRRTATSSSPPTTRFSARTTSGWRWRIEITGPYRDVRGPVDDRPGRTACAGRHQGAGQLPVRRRHRLACARAQLGPHPGRAGRESRALHGPPRPVRRRPHRACGAAAAPVLHRRRLARGLTPAVCRPGVRVLAAPEPVAGTWQVLRFDPESTALVPAVGSRARGPRLPRCPTGRRCMPGCASPARRTGGRRSR